MCTKLTDLTEWGLRQKTLIFLSSVLIWILKNCLIRKIFKKQDNPLGNYMYFSFSFHHQMLLRAWSLQMGKWSPLDVTSGGTSPGLMSGGGWKLGLQIWCPERGCPTMWPIPWCIWCYLPASIGQTDICENSTFHKLCLPAVIISVVILTDTSILLTSNRFALSVTHGCVVLSLPPETLSIL